MLRRVLRKSLILEPRSGIEPETSSLPWMRSTNWAIAAWKPTNSNIFAAVEASYFWRRVFLLVVDSGFGRFGATNASNSAQAMPFTK